MVVHLPGMQRTLATPQYCPNALAPWLPGPPWLASPRTLLSRPSGCRDSNPTAMFLPSSAPTPTGARASKWSGFCQPDLEAVGPDEGGILPAFPICLAMFFHGIALTGAESPAGSIRRRRLDRLVASCVWARRAPIRP